MTKDSEVWMVLGNNEEKGACVAVVIAATAERAKDLYQRQYPGHVPLAWPSLFDLKQSVRTLEHARDGVHDGTCPVIRDDGDGAEASSGAPIPSHVPCPVSVLRVLDRLRELMEQRGLADPFENAAASFECAAFKAHAYRWEPEEAPGRFIWRDIVVSWTKRLNRDPRISRAPTKPELVAMWEECRAGILLHEKMEEAA